MSILLELAGERACQLLYNNDQQKSQPSQPPGESTWPERAHYARFCLPSPAPARSTLSSKLRKVQFINSRLVPSANLHPPPVTQLSPRRRRRRQRIQGSRDGDGSACTLPRIRHDDGSLRSCRVGLLALDGTRTRSGIPKKYRHANWNRNARGWGNASGSGGGSARGSF